MANLFQPSLVRATDSDGNPISGARLLFYASETTTPATWFTDQAGTVPGTNPHTADSSGLFDPAYLDPDTTYRVVLTDAGGVTILDVDPVRGYDQGAVQTAATEAASSALAAQTAETNAETAQANAEDAQAAAEVSAGQALAASTAGEAYPNDYASALPRGVTAIAITAAGSGYTDGTYAGGVSGGPTGFSWTYTVSGGVVTATAITNAGLSTATTAPTLSLPSGSGTGATATATVAPLVADQASYWAASTDGKSLNLWKRNGSAVAAVNNPSTGGQIRVSQANLVEEVIGKSRPYIKPPSATDPLYRLIEPELLTFVGEVKLAWPAGLGVRELDADGSNRFRFILGGGDTLDGAGAYPEIARGHLVAGALNRGYAGLTRGDRLPIYATGTTLGVPDGTIVGYMRIDFDGTPFGSYYHPTAPYTQANAGLIRDQVLPTETEIDTIEVIAQRAVETAPETQVWDTEATDIPAYARALIKKLVIFNSETDNLRVSSVITSGTSFQVNLFDNDLNDEVGYFPVASPDYEDFPERVLLNPIDPLSTLPSGDPDGANYSGLAGYLEINDSSVVVSGAPTLITSAAQGRINPSTIHTPYSIPAKPRDSRLWNYRHIIRSGAGRDYTTPRAAAEALYRDGPLAAPLGVQVQPVSLVARQDNPVAIILDPGTYQDVNLHLPDWVSLIAEYPGSVTFEHSSGATRPIIQAHLNHQLVGINWRNTVAEGTDYQSSPTTSSARYAVHRDFFHLSQVADAQGNYVRSAALDVIGGSFIVGSAAGIQPLGMAITKHDIVRVLDTDLLSENGSYSGSLLSANNSSSTAGGGRFEVRNVRDLTTRATSLPTLGVQSKQANDYPNELVLDGVKGFDTIAYTGTGLGGWTLRGNWSGSITNTVDGTGDPGFYQ
ncbi:MAG: hypothetical protein CL801_08385 [Citromicrobium sp.]|nr:hypothetical protein [Citromicrobium sp.]